MIHQNEAGFTLLEVLVALVILSFSLSALFENLSISSRISMKSELNFQAGRIANNLFMDYKMLDSLINSQAVVKGRIDDDEYGREWAYSFEINPLIVTLIDGAKGDGEEAPFNVEVPNMYRITLHLEAPFRSLAQTISFQFVKWVRP